MRLTVLLIAGIFLAQGAVIAQTITFSGKDIAMNKVFEVIEQQTGYVISGDKSILTSSKPVTVAVSNVPLDQFLYLIFKDQHIAYRIRGKNIFLSRSRDPSTKNELSVTGTPAPFPLAIITGTVRSRKGELLPGASIRLKGMQSGTTTDAQGNFSLRNIPEKTILQISSIGYETIEVVINEVPEGYTAVAVKRDQVDNVRAIPGKLLTIDILLENSNSQMNQVIVNGYSNINKSNFTGSAVTIKRDELLKVAPTNVLRSLQIFDPSFKVTDNNSLGADPNNINPVYIRGRSGIGDVTLPNDEAALTPTQLRNDPNLPTFILDGYEVTAQRIFDLDPTRVESITILKDAASTAIYGSRAANGVVVVETVKPVSGKLRINYSLNGSVTAPDLSGYHLLNARDKLELERITGMFEPRPDDQPSGALARERSYYGKLAEIDRGVETDWLSQPLRTGLNQRHNILVEGGSKEFIFGGDLNFARTQGVMKGSGRNNNSIGFSISYRKNNLMFRNYIQWNNIQSQESPFGSFATYAMQNPYDDFRDEDGAYKKLLTNWGHPGSPLGNPLYDAHLKSYNRTAHNDFSNNFSLRWTIANGLRLDTRLSVLLQKSQQQHFKDPASSQFNNMEFTKRGTKSILDDELRTWDFNALLLYGRGYGKHFLNMTLGANANQKDLIRSGYSVQGFLTGNTDDVNFAAEILNKPTGDNEKSRLVGFLASANYSYDNIYLLDFSGRYDGASQFGSNVRFAPFWSLGAGINIHNYAGIKQNYPWLNNLKVRSNYGQVGKAGFSQSVSKSTYGYNFEDWYVFGIGANLVTLANPDLKWEKTTMLDYGVDVTVFNRLSITFNYYHKNTVDLIGDITLPVSTGFTSYKSNLGEILNKGYEFNVRYQLINRRSVSLSLYATAAHNSNKFLKIGDALKEYNKRVEKYYQDNDVVDKPLNKYFEGASLTAMYAMRSLGVNPADGREIFLDRNGDVTYTWNQTQHVVVGDTEPDWRGSFGFNFTYKNFFVFTGFLYELGGDMYNNTLVSKVENANVYWNVDKRVFSDRWQKPGDITYLKDVRLWNETTQVTSRFVQRNNYIDFNSITLGYDLPQRLLSRWKINNCRVQITSNELGRISSIDIERGTDYPYARTLNFTLNLGI
ncbi:SusC/RagA family TonB-linked outer membrane protein [Longitalea luteola]|uniref:SusC/RagA family TonB-linked outer membrane protein n=1 Tax=Longitalea luteola TaxID=2812563 RepID=UPI001A95FB37|nr:SusC/RagA family TonB-linked outer membrane protein [Longitalea luteola]